MCKCACLCARLCASKCVQGIRCVQPVKSMEQHQIEACASNLGNLETDFLPIIHVSRTQEHVFLT